MGAMKDFNIWLEDNGHARELTQGVLFDDDEDLLETQHDMDAILDDEDEDWVRGHDDDTMPLFDEHGGLTSEGYEMLYELEQDGGMT